MRKYKSIFFDLDNTLWDFDKNSFEALKQTYLHYGINNTISDFNTFYSTYSKINDACWQEYREQKISKKELIIKRFKNTLEHFSIKEIDFIEFNGQYLGSMAKQLHLIEGAIEILEYLKSKNYKLFIITNGFKEVQYKKLENTGLLKYFQKVFVSEEVKAPKPHKEIFEHALKSSNSAKKHSIMIGDSWESDILGSKQFGIDQVHFSNRNNIFFTLEEKKELLNSKNLTHRINKLEQIKQYL